MNKSYLTRSKTEIAFKPIKLDIESFFKKHGKQVRVLYRTSMDKFGEPPDNLIPKKIVNDRLVVFVNFRDKTVSPSNIEQIYAFTEGEGEKLLNEYPLKSRLNETKIKINLKNIPHKYKFENIVEFKKYFQNFKQK